MASLLSPGSLFKKKPENNQDFLSKLRQSVSSSQKPIQTQQASANGLGGMFASISPNKSASQQTKTILTPTVPRLNGSSNEFQKKQPSQTTSQPFSTLKTPIFTPKTEVFSDPSSKTLVQKPVLSNEKPQFQPTKNVLRQSKPSFVSNNQPTFKKVVTQQPAVSKTTNLDVETLTNKYKQEERDALEKSKSWLDRMTDNDAANDKLAEINARNRAISEVREKSNNDPAVNAALKASANKNLQQGQQNYKTIDQSAANFAGNYLNPVGEHGLFGRQSIAKNTKIISKGADAARKFIDENIDPEHANGKFDSFGDIVRFAAQLPIGMIEAPLTSPKDVREAVTGQRLETDDAGNITGERELSALQRTGAGANALINTAGMAFGGSGTLLKAATKQAAEQTAKQTGRQIAAQIAKDALKESAEEGVQSLATDLQERGRFDEGSLERLAQNAALGAAGGGIMSGAGKVIPAIRNAKTALDEKLSNMTPEQRRGILEGGFIAGPKAADFNEAQSAGRVFEGPDGKSRFEVSDENMRIKNPEGQTLGELVEHPELFRNYPDMADMPIERTDFADAAGMKSVNGSMGKDRMYLNHNLQGDDMLDTTLHEFNHGIQHREGFAPGGTPESARAYVNDMRVKAYQKLQKARKSPAKIARDNINNDLLEGRIDLEQYGRLSDELETRSDVIALRKAEVDFSKWNRLQGRPDGELYKLLAGEAESRAAVARRTMTDAERYVDGLKSLWDDMPDAKSITSERNTLLEKIRDRTASVDDLARYSLLKDMESVAQGKKSAPDPERWVSDKWISLPHAVYRGTSEHTGSNMASFGGGLYTAAKRSEAAKYGKVEQLGSEALPSNPLQFKTEADFKQWEYEMARQLGTDRRGLYDNNTGVETLVNALGYDGITIGAGKDMIAVKYSLDQIGQYKPRSTFYDSLDVPYDDLIVRTDSGGEARAMSLDPAKALETIKKFDDILRGNRRVTKLASVDAKLAQRIEQETGIKVSSGASIELTNKNAIHIHNRHIINPDEMLPLSDTDIAALPEVIRDPDVITREKVVRGAQRIKFERNIDGTKKAVAEVIKKGDALNVVTYFNDSPSYRPNKSMSISEDIRPKRDTSESLTNIIPNQTDTVNTIMSRSEAMQKVIGDKYPDAVQKLIEAESYANNVFFGDTQVISKSQLRGVFSSDIPTRKQRANLRKRGIDPGLTREDYDIADLPSYYFSKQGVRPEEVTIPDDNHPLNNSGWRYAEAEDVVDSIKKAIRAFDDLEQARNELRDLQTSESVINDTNKLLQESAAIKQAAANTESDKQIALQSMRDNLDAIVENESKETGIPTSDAMTAAGHIPTQGRINNIPLKGKQMLTKGDLYKMTKVGSRDWVGNEINGHRLHVKVAKNGQQFASFEKQDQKTGKWYPETRAAYIWHTQKKAIGSVETDEALQKALVEARQSGQVVDYIARRNNYDPNDIETVPLTGDYTIDGGLIRDPNTGQVLGDHVQVTPFGVVTQIAGKFNIIEPDSIEGFGNKGKRTDTYARTLRNNIKDDTLHKQQYDSLINRTRQAEADYRQDLASRFETFEQESKLVNKTKPRGVTRKDWNRDLFRFIENKFTHDDGSKTTKTIDQMFESKYGPTQLAAAKRFMEHTRKLYDDVLDEVNAEYRRLGREEIPKRKDYITHLMEKDFLDKMGVSPEVLTGIMGDISSSNRGELPGSIAGLTQNFKPNTKYNPFFKARRGNDSATDPFVAVETYLQAALYNKHMTEPTMRARQFESALRAADDVGQGAAGNNLILKEMSKEMQGAFKDYRGDHSDFIDATKDYANALAGKTTDADRWIINRKGGRNILKGLRWLQSMTGQNKILGNYSSTLSQALNIPDTVRTNGVANTIKGVIAALGDKRTNDAMKQSPFLRARYTEAQGKFITSKMGKVRNVLGTASGMRHVEKAFVEMSWSASYQKALKAGKRGFDAVLAADQDAARTVGDRGIAQMPEVYRSTIGKTFLQFTYEVNESGKNTLSSGAKGMAKYFIASFLVNEAFQAATGNRPLPDLINAGIETAKDMANPDDDEDKKGNKLPNDLVQAGQRLLSEMTSMSGSASAAANLIPKEQRSQIFGQESDFGRYSGAPASASTAGELLIGGSNLLNGDITGAAESARDSVLPAGSQVRKTTAGLGKLTEEDANPSVADWPRGILFGKNAIGAEKVTNAATLFGDVGESDSELSGTEKQKTTAGSLGSTGDYGRSSVSKKDYTDALTRRKSNRDDNGYSKEYSESMDKLWDDRVIGISEGKYEVKDGQLVNSKTGKVASDWYKDYAQKATENGETGSYVYEAYSLGYGFPTEGQKTKDLDGKYNSFDRTASNSDIVNFAVGLATNSKDGYENIPDAVKAQYYQKSGISTSGTYKYNPAGLANDQGYVSDIDYAVATKQSVSVKTEAITNDISSIMSGGGKRSAMLDYLAGGRKKSIAGEYWVTNGVLDQLYDDGIISKSERADLKRITDSGSKSKTSSSNKSAKSAASAIARANEITRKYAKENIPDMSTASPKTKIEMAKSRLAASTSNRYRTASTKVSIRKGAHYV